MREGLSNLPCKMKVEGKNPFNNKILFLEKSLNQDIEYFMKNTIDNKSFRLLLQINRLIYLLGELYQDQS
jgi:hypothetical protein